MLSGFVTGVQNVISQEGNSNELGAHVTIVTGGALVRLGYDRTRQFPRGSTWCGDHDGCAGGEKSKPFNHGYYHL